MIRTIVSHHWSLQPIQFTSEWENLLDWIFQLICIGRRSARKYVWIGEESMTDWGRVGYWCGQDSFLLLAAAADVATVAAVAAVAAVAPSATFLSRVVYMRQSSHRGKSLPRCNTVFCFFQMGRMWQRRFHLDSHPRQILATEPMIGRRRLMEISAQSDAAFWPVSGDGKVAAKPQLGRLHLNPRFTRANQPFI